MVIELKSCSLNEECVWILTLYWCFIMGVPFILISSNCTFSFKIETWKIVAKCSLQVCSEYNTVGIKLLFMYEEQTFCKWVFLNWFSPNWCMVELTNLSSTTKQYFCCIQSFLVYVSMYMLILFTVLVEKQHMRGKCTFAWHQFEYLIELLCSRPWVLCEISAPPISAFFFFPLFYKNKHLHHVLVNA